MSSVDPTPAEAPGRDYAPIEHVDDESLEPRRASSRRGWIFPVLVFGAIILLGILPGESDGTPVRDQPGRGHDGQRSHGGVLDKIGHWIGDTVGWRSNNGTAGSGRLTWGSFASGWSESTVYVVSTDAYYRSRPASFGAHISDEQGLRGYLLPISSLAARQAGMDEADELSQERDYACEDAQPNRDGRGNNDDFDDAINTVHHRRDNGTDTDETVQFIALILRGKCSFADKVRRAQSLGAVGALIGDSAPHNSPLLGSGSSLVGMWGPDAHDIIIPSAFVSAESYSDLRRLYQEYLDHPNSELGVAFADQSTLVQASDATSHTANATADRGLAIVMSQDQAFDWPLMDLCLLLLFLPSVLTLLTLGLHRVRVARRRRQDRAPKHAVESLPCILWSEHLDDDLEKAEREGLSTAEVLKSHATPTSWLARIGLRARTVLHDAKTYVLLRPTTAAHEDDASLQDASPEASGSSAPLQAVSAASLTPAARKRIFGQRECSICLCDFEVGEAVRVLPCGHLFHQVEVDPWLLQTKRVCPVCRTSITDVPRPTAAANAVLVPVEESADSSRQTNNERTPLLD
ncbi:uncharacterized protein L969DRAFT_92441 [Mixia osmundae IAM 14324]|uniref:RING-type E3 ubiquitin transferase n=1 Tax=Mixia osmundae (strain CBS 9802 / IAM 14324 / JCM 22182 / KY 12970) TaxID=764103 RepID=G7DXI9_MIXOS|nr:uncharacterized protein L969DRAFT_92441 [Mixia osmundae IAM 14324]KEI41207.1 hypothetical protein L969DRAFT_92441 [Mixia osmundae IAM 14324]GAA95299.1 hypothetical protein E5Q_01956 [Mixia osmundae IAM 14324]